MVEKGLRTFCICKKCGQEKLHHAKGLCKKCYCKEQYKKNKGGKTWDK